MHSVLARRVLAAALVAVCSFFVQPSAVAPARARTVSAPSTDVYRRALSAREYEATETAAGLQAPNRAHGLRTFFDGAGARVVDRSDASHELARVRTIAIGREASLARLETGEVRASGAHVEIRRSHVVEWYENSERGLEQGWTFAERPDGDGALAIEVDLGALATVVDGRATIEASDRRLEYGGLAAWDASGRTLVARMEPAACGARLRIVVDDVGATYPVTVDPGLTTPAYATLSSGQSSSIFGSAVAGAGDVNGDGYDDVIVGAQYYDSGGIESGGAFVFLGGPNGVASSGVAAAATTLRSDQNGSLFGQSVAGAGDVNGDGYDDVVVGAPYYTLAQTQEGAAFVFLGGPNGIASGGPSSAATTLRSDQAVGILGWSADGAGDVNGDGYDDVVVGAPAYDAGQTDEGAAFVFLGGPGGVASGTPASAASILQSDVAGANFGWSVHTAGDTNGDGFADVIVGAPDYASGQSDEGGAFVFLGGSLGVSTAASAVLQANQSTAHFGESVSGGGDTNGDGFADVVVGAPLYDGVDSSSGAAFVFRGGPSGVASGSPSTATTSLAAFAASATFGVAVDTGDVNGDGFADVVVGASAFSSGQSSEGAVFVFLGGPSGVANASSATADVALQSDQAFASFGSPVACAGDTNGDGYADVVAGARNFDGVQVDDGAAFVYRGTADGINGYPPPKGRLAGNQATSHFGVSVAGAGDVNADGFDDVIVGAEYFDNGAGTAGAAFVFLGGPAGIANGTPGSAATALLGDQVGERFGSAVAGAGDVNGDGYDDVAIAAPDFADDLPYEGLTCVFLGGPSGIPNGGPSTASTRIEGDFNYAAIGSTLASAGDVDNDGYDDLLVGSPIYPTSITSLGVVYVFRGGPSGIPSGGVALAATTLVGDVPGDEFANSISGAGDVNGDGYDDVIVGAWRYDVPTSEEGAAFVYLGGPNGIPNGGPSTARAVLVGNQQSANFGTSVAGAGDVNADGYDDVIVGAFEFDSGETDEGGAFVFLGGPGGVASGSTSTAATILQADVASAKLGSSVAGAGDVNGDGYDDVVVGATGYDGIGAAFVYLGGPGRGVANGSPRTAAVTVRAVAGGMFGAAVAGVGDVNRDGLDDFAVGAPSAAGTLNDDGAAYVYSRPPAVRAKDTPGLYVPSSGAVFLRNTNTPGGADTAFVYGAPNAGYRAISGDWDANGIDTVGLYSPSTGAFFLTDDNVPGPADHVFVFGAGGAGSIPISGDWDGDGVDSVGLYVPATGTFFLRNANTSGPADAIFTFGASGGGFVPVAGDWNGDGTDTVGLYQPATGAFFLRNENAPGPADLLFVFGPPSVAWAPLAGDFDGDGTDTVALYNPTNGTFFLRNANAAGSADLAFTFGGPGLTPLVGDWNGK